MTADRPESTVPSFGMNRKSYHRTLSERLTPLLISRGLVSGTTRMFALRLLSRGIPAGVSYAPDGSGVDTQSQGWLFSNNALRRDDESQAGMEGE